ncbi:MAG: hypothetical protein J7J92_03230 [Candidatus Aenigmarchaeota archaeon]|nr:hypothetical protein [Candidatus Aenigmarchaeota archaeon]
MGDVIKIKKSTIKIAIIIIVIFSFGLIVGKGGLSTNHATGLTLTVVTSDKCNSCDSSQIVEAVKRLFSGIKVNTISYENGGKAIVDKMGIKMLPAYIFSADVKNEGNFSLVEKTLEEKNGEYYIIPDAVGSSFDPLHESECSDGEDDDNDGKIDCNDPDCSTSFKCVEKRETPEVDLFVMAYCPYGTQTEKAFLPVLELLGDKIDFNLRFVYYAMHGKKELDEQLRQYCIQKEQKSKLLPYLRCFLEAGKSEECLNKTNINKDALNSCINKTDKEFKVTEKYNDKSTWLSGRFPLFDIDKELNEKYNVGGSPSLAFNGVSVPSFARNPEALLKLICDGFKDKPSECEQKLSTDTPSPGFGFSGTGNSGGSCG